MQPVFCKLLLSSGKSIAAEVDVPARILRMGDVKAKYSALADYINDEYDLGDDEVSEVIDARGYYY